MKKIFTLIAFVMIVSQSVAQTITVTGAANTALNKTYTLCNDCGFSYTTVEPKDAGTNSYFDSPASGLPFDQYQIYRKDGIWRFARAYMTTCCSLTTVPNLLSVVGGDSKPPCDWANGTMLSGDCIAPVTPSCTLSLASSTTTCEGANANFYPFANGTSVNFSYSWTGPNGFTSSTHYLVIPSVSTANAGTYGLTVTSGDGCTTSATTALIVNPKPERPGRFEISSNVINPPRNGVNYQIPNISGLTSIWEYSGTGITFSNQTSHATNINYAANATSGILSVKATNGSCESEPRLMNVAVQPPSTGPLVVCNAPQNQSFPISISDQNGGIIMAWSDLRNDNTSPQRNDLYIQRLDANGNVLWTSNGVQVTSGNVFDELYPQLAICKTSSGQTRIMLVWLSLEGPDENNLFPYTSKIKLQAFDLNGNPAYANPIVLGDGGSFNAYYPQITASPDMRKLIVGYMRSVPTELRVQAVEPDNGSLLYGTNGNLISAVSGPTIYKCFVMTNSDDGAGINVFWEHLTDIRAQRVNISTGNVAWASPITICSAADNQYISDAVGDIVVWEDNRQLSTETGNREIYAQKVNANGTVAWQANGLKVYEDDRKTSQSNPVLAKADDGVFVTWSENTSQTGSQARLTIQKVLNNGTFPWGARGTHYQSFRNGANSAGTVNVKICSQPDGGAVVTYFGSNQGFLKAQRINADGRPLWREYGEPIAGLNYNMFSSEFINIFPLETGGAWIGFPDLTANIYAVKAQICNTPPAAPTLFNVKRCNPQPVPFQLFLNAGNCTSGGPDWYKGSFGSDYILSRNPYIPRINSDTTYYAACIDYLTGCASSSLTSANVDVVIWPNIISPQTLPAIYNSTNSPAKIEANLKITAQNQIQSGANVIYNSGGAIELLPNFQAGNGSIFLSEIKGCIDEN